MPGPTPHYPPEFKREADQLYRSSDRSVSKVAEELGVATESLRRWIKQHEVDADKPEDLFFKDISLAPDPDPDDGLA